MVRRNSNGNGSIIKRKDGTFTVRIQQGKKPNGKPNIKERRAKTKREANQILKQLKKEIETEDRRKTIGFTEYTTEEYFKLFLKYKERELSDTSYIRLESTFKKHILPHVGLTMIEHLTGDMIQSILDDMYTKGLSHSSIKKVYDLCNACFTWAIEKRKDISYDENPMSEVAMISSKKFKKNKVRSMTYEEIELFKKEALRQYKTGRFVHKLGPLFILILNTGLRAGEACALDRNQDVFDDHILVQNNAVTIINSDINSRADKKRITVVRKNDTKTTSGDRVIPLNKTAQKMVEILKTQFIELDENNLLIYNYKYKVIPPVNLVKPFKEICRSAGIENIDGCGPHMLRHTFATTLFDKGYDVKVVSELLGHKDVHVTQDVYIDIINKKKAEAVSMIDI